MASPIGPLEALEIVTKAVQLYKKIHDYPDEIAAVGRRIEDLEFYLSELRDLINDKRRHSLANLRPQQTERLRTIISDIERDARDVYEILKIWDSAGSVARALFAVGKNPRKLEDLTSSMDQRKQDLRDILQLLGLFAIHPQPPLRPVTPTAPRRADLSVIFVDPHNLGRSKVAEGYMKLLHDWTLRTNGEWRVKFSHSAGMRLAARSDCADVLKSLPKPILVEGGNKTPNEAAMASLFDNKYFDYPWKPAIRAHMVESRSRGIIRSMFKYYDFILVFTGREYENLLSLKEALVQANGPSIAPPGKGRMIHLGAYLDRKNKPVEIVDAPKGNDGKPSRANWNATTSRIKLSVKAFLKNELDWKQPSKGAQQS